MSLNREQPMRPFLDELADAFEAYEVPDGSIGTNELADGAVTGSKIANKAVNMDKLADDVLIPQPTDAQVTSSVNAWLDANPEATTTVQDGAISTVKLADGAVTDAKLAQTGGVLEKFYGLGIVRFNMFNPSTITEGKYLDGNGVLVSNASFFASDFIDLTSMETVKLSYTHIARFFDANKAIIHLSDAYASIDSDVAVTIPSGAKYLRFSTYNQYLNSAQVGAAINRSHYIAYGSYCAPLLVSGEDGTKQQLDLLNYSSNGNLYNVYSVVMGKYINPSSGDILDTAGAGWGVAYSLIPVTAGEPLCSNRRVIVAYYDEYLRVVGALQLDSSKTTTVPSGAKFARFSVSDNDHSTVVVMRGTSASSIGPYSFTLQGLLDSDDVPIVVDASGNGDYTSFTEAVYENLSNNNPIVVKPGTYDIESEYVALFGQSVVDNLTDSTTGIREFQRGVIISNRTVTFEAGSHVVCDWTGHTVDGTHRFCAIAMFPNSELIGLDLECTGTWYCIHDDYDTQDSSPFTVKYKNCRVIGHNLVNVNCIGGGCHKYSRHVIENCYLNNNRAFTSLVGSADMRYHNTATADAEPEVYVSNCIFSNNLNLTYYGTQTTKMRAYVNNCYAPHGINKLAESSSSTVDNVELYKWNNVESA